MSPAPAAGINGSSLLRIGVAACQPAFMQREKTAPRARMGSDGGRPRGPLPKRGVLDRASRTVQERRNSGATCDENINLLRSRRSPGANGQDPRPTQRGPSVMASWSAKTSSATRIFGPRAARSTLRRLRAEVVTKRTEPRPSMSARPGRLAQSHIRAAAGPRRRWCRDRGDPTGQSHARRRRTVRTARRCGRAVAPRRTGEYKGLDAGR